MGSVVLSLDAELAWGFHDANQLPNDRVATARESWLDLLDLFDEFDVPATWAVVGHLLLDSCDGDHPDHPTPDGWFDRDPGTRESRDEKWYGSELVDAIEDASADHEIGSRTFSNVDLSNTTREVAVAEIREAVAVGERRGRSVNSFTFPHGHVGHRDVLAAYGIKCYRGTQTRPWYDRGVLGSATRLLGWPTGVVSPTIVEPEEDEYGLVTVPASLNLFGFGDRLSATVERVTDDPVVSMAKRGIDRVATEDGVFHVWLRLNDLTSEHDLERIRSVVEYAAQVRAETGLTIETMGEIAAAVKDDEPRPREPIGPR